MSAATLSAAAHAAAAALDALRTGTPVVLACVLQPTDVLGARAIFTEEGCTTPGVLPATLERALTGHAQRALRERSARVVAVEEDGATWHVYLEPQVAAERLLVFGAGHIAVPLSTFADALGFDVTVLDDRDEFATAERFPPAVSVLRTDFDDPLAGISVDERTFVVLVTRAHKYDFDTLRRLLQQPARPHYIGMVGSRRRVRAAFAALLEEGIPRDHLAHVHAPIGLDIGAETPEEIALSICAEMVLVRRGGSGTPLHTRERVLERLLPEAQ